jgi:serine O-acetyltransferase
MHWILLCERWCPGMAAANDMQHGTLGALPIRGAARVPDMARERPTRFWDPSRRLLKAIRDYQAARISGRVWAWPVMKYCALRHRFWSVVTGAEIDLNSTIGGGLLLPHPNGIVIHPAAVIGPNCMIFQQVTIGTTARGGYPVIGGHVDIGAGARILGPVTIGDHAVIGANAVVLCDVPAYGRAVGIPAVVSLRTEPGHG